MTRLLALGVALTWATLVVAQPLTPVNSSQEFLFLLDPESPEMGTPDQHGDTPYINHIWCWDPTAGAAGEARPVFNELFKLFDDPAGPDVRVLSLSCGEDQVDRLRNHGDIHFSIKRTDPGQSPGSNGDLAQEHQRDTPGDMYATDSVYDPTQAIGGNEKSAEENTLPVVPRQFQRFPQRATAGIHGGTTGSPLATAAQLPSDIIGFDYHGPNEAFGHDKVYFTIDSNWTNPATNIPHTPTQILVYDLTNTVPVGAGVSTLWDFGPNSQHQERRILLQGDKIDAISLDMVHSVAIKQKESVVFSLAEGSTSLHSAFWTSSVRLHAGDLFTWPKHPSAPPPPGSGNVLFDHMYRTVFASGIHPADGDIDGITCIDPLTERQYSNESGGAPANANKFEPLYAPLEEVAEYQGHNSGEPNGVSYQGGWCALLNQSVVAGGHYNGRIFGSAGGTGYQWPVSVSGTIPSMAFNPITSMNVSLYPNAQSPTGLEFTWDAQNFTLTNGQMWQPRLNGAIQNATTSNSFIASGLHNQLGMHTLGVRLVDQNNQNESGFVYHAYYVESDVDLPGIVSFTATPNNQTGAHSLDLELEIPATLAEVEVLFNGQAIPNVQRPPVGNAFVTHTTAHWGLHHVEVIGLELGTSLPSNAQERYVVMPRPSAGEILQTVAWGQTDSYITGMTLHGPTSELIVVDSGGGISSVNPNDLTVTTSVDYNSTNFYGGAKAYGVASDGTSVHYLCKQGSGSPWEMHLDTGGYSSSAGNRSSFVANYAFTFLGGDICYTGGIADEFLVADLTFFQALGTQYRGFDPVYGGSASGPNPTVLTTNATIAPHGLFESFAIGWVPPTPGQLEHNSDGTLIVPHCVNGQTLGFMNVGRDGTVIAGFELDTPINGTVTALAYVTPSGVPATVAVPTIVAAIGAYSEDGFATTLYEFVAPRGLTSDFDVHNVNFDAFFGEGTPEALSDVDSDGDFNVELFSVLFPRDNEVIGDLDVEIDYSLSKTTQMTFWLTNGEKEVLLGHLEDEAGSHVRRFDDLGSGSFDDLAGDRRSMDPLALFDGSTTNGDWNVKVVTNAAAAVVEEVKVLVQPEVAPKLIVRGDPLLQSAYTDEGHLFLLLFLSGQAPAGPCVEAYDVNGDGFINPADASLLGNYLIGTTPIWEMSDPTDEWGCAGYRPL